jgi:limonene-1,2-epoxide hydrolase
MMKHGKIISYILFPLLFIPGCSTTPSPEQVVRNYVEAQKNHQIDLSLEYFDEETAFMLPGGITSLTGMENIRQMAQYDSVMNTQLHIESLRVDGNLVTCRIFETNRWLDLAGLPPLRYDSTLFYVVGGKIRKIVAFPADSSVRALSQSTDTFIRWLAQTHPKEATELLSGGGFSFNAANADILLKFLAEWRDSTAIQ